MIAESAGSHDSDDSFARDTPGSPDLGAADEKAAKMVALFRRVLEETVGQHDDQAFAEVRQRMVEVARAHRGKSLELVPMVIELTKAALSPELRRALIDPAIYDEMAASISKSIFSDPQAQVRLNALWASLQEAAHE
jgi:hypothetical protein